MYLSPEMQAIRKLSGAQSFGEFAQMFQQLAQGKGQEQPGPGTPNGETAPQPQGGGSGDPRLNTWNAAEQQAPGALTYTNNINLQKGY